MNLVIIFIIIIIIILLIYKYATKPKYNIPLNLFQTWETKELPESMFQCTQRLKQANPEFKYFLYDDKECRSFIKNNFDLEVLEAYDTLIPGAYKADLWRYCILYKYGGIYLDIKYYNVNDFKLIELAKNDININNINNINLVQDLPKSNYNNFGIYNAFIISKPNDKFLLKCINKVVDNVNQRYYGHNSLAPTGPAMMGDLYLEHNSNVTPFDLRFDGKYILYKNKKILQMYDSYRKEQKNNSSKKHYSELWKIRRIYN
jgi:mannosyltransferase OCH1-like enzyme